MPYDYGFELPDLRHGFYDKAGEFVGVRIVRHWYETEDDDVDFKVSFNVVKAHQVTELPIGTKEEQAVTIAHELYEEDREATDSYNETEAMYAAERRMGA